MNRKFKCFSLKQQGMGDESNPFLLVDTSAQNCGRLKENSVAKYIKLIANIIFLSEI